MTAQIDELWSRYLGADATRRKKLFASVARAHGKGFAKQLRDEFAATEAAQATEAQFSKERARC